MKYIFIPRYAINTQLAVPCSFGDVEEIPGIRVITRLVVTMVPGK